MKSYYIAVVLIILTILSIFSCKTTTKLDKQNINYTQQWEAIDSLVDRQLYKQAEKLLNNIIDVAFENNDELEGIRAALALSQLKVEDLDTYMIEKLPLIETAADTMNNEVGKALLEYAIGMSYFKYWESNEGVIPAKFQGRIPDDLRLKEWSAGMFKSKIDSSFDIAKQSIQNNDVAINELKSFFTTDSISSSITLYEFLIQEEIRINQSNLFENLNESKSPECRGCDLLGNEFLNFDEIRTRPLTQKEIVMSLYRDLFRKFKDLGQNELWIEGEIQKIQYLYEEVQQGSGNEYEVALSALEKIAENLDLAYITKYYLAELQRNKSNNQNLSKKEQSNYRQSAVAVYMTIISIAPQTNYAKNAQSNIDLLNKKELSAIMEATYLPEAALLVNLSHHEVTKVYYRIFRLSKEDYLGQDIRNLEDVKGAKLIKTGEIMLPKNNFPFVHQSTDIFLEGLSSGYYGIAIANNHDFKSKDDNTVFETTFLVSNIAIHQFQDEQKGVNILQAINRTTGERLLNADFLIYRRTYNQKSRQQEYILKETYNNVDEVSIAVNQAEVIFPLAIVGQDYLMQKNGIYASSDRYKATTEAHILTDRSIYRPGQIIYFKGLLVQKDKARYPAANKNQKFQLEIKDAFGNDLSKMTLESDENGAFDSSVQLPEKLPNGRVSFQINFNDQRIWVNNDVTIEEYKRPKFKVDFLPIEEKVALNGEVSLTAKAISLIELPIIGANVNYKVYRKKYLPFFYRSSYRIFPPMRSEKVLITSGETVSDNNGEIVIQFQAVADQAETVWNNNYVFEVQIDVTDETGETQSATKEITISEQSVFLTIDQEKTKPNEIIIAAKNAEGEAVNANVGLKVHQSNQKEFKISRYWLLPDTVISLNNLADNHYVMDEREVGFDQMVYETEFALTDVRTIDLHELVGVGSFKITLFTEGGNEITREVVVNNFDSGEFSVKDLVYFTLNKNTLNVGEKLEIKIGSSLPDVQFQLLKFKDNKLLDEKWTTLNGIYNIEADIAEADKGGFTYIVNIFHQNRVYTYTHQISVPWIEKQLFITPKTFRTVTEPGAIEKWIFQVSDYEGNPVKAYFSSAMYDASLDQIKSHQWGFSLFPMDQTNYYLNSSGFGQTYFYGRNYSWNNVPFQNAPLREYLQFKYLPEHYFYYLNDMAVMRSAGMPEKLASSPPPPSAEMARDTALEEVPEEENLEEKKDPVVRRNLKETVYFYPLLSTNDQGEVEIDFTMNEALTTWKMINFAYTPELENGFSEIKVQTRKNIMIQANQVRFLRMNDEIELTAKLINLTERKIAVKPELLVYDALSGAALKNLFINYSETELEMEPMEQKTFSWRIKVPEHVPMLRFVYQLISEAHQDAEEHIIPVMPDKVYLIESEIINVYGEKNEVTSLPYLSDAKKETQRLVVESFGSPVWMVIQALPFLSENKHEHADAIFNRYFANKLALKLIQDNPLIKSYFDTWKEKGQLNSSLKTNELLKNIDLNLTPWLADALSEEEQMQLLAEVMSNDNIEAETEEILVKLKELQLSNGGFPWFAKGRDSYYISQMILEGIIRMERMNLLSEGHSLLKVKKTLIEYCREEELEIYKKFLKDKGDMVPNALLKGVYINILSGLEVDNNSYNKLIKDVEARVKKDWYKYSMNEQLYISWIFIEKQKSVSLEIAQSFLERSFYAEKIGRYWKANNSYFGYANEIEQHAKVMELFHELGTYNSTIEELKYWLISNKRNNSWSSSVATSAAIYSLTLGESNSFIEGKSVETYLGGNLLVSDVNKAGVNYDKYVINDSASLTEIKNLEFKNPNKNTAWVNVHHQFFQKYEDVERTEGGSLNLKKEVYVIDAKDGLESITGATLQNGDRIKVRLLIESDRNMQFVHLMDERPSGMEPIDKLSGYQWGNAVSFYKSINDLATHFFIEFIPKGIFIIEYEMIVNNVGIYDSGVAKIQNLYAPEFNDFSKSFEIRVGNDK